MIKIYNKIHIYNRQLCACRSYINIPCQCNPHTQYELKKMVISIVVFVVNLNADVINKICICNTMNLRKITKRQMIYLINKINHLFYQIYT